MRREPGVFVYAAVPPERLPALPARAVVHEAEGPCAVLPREAARAAGLASVFEAAWLTLTVHSDLAAVGLTAAVSRALAERGIACNVLAGLNHDHLLVPAARADEAIACLRALRPADA